MAKELKVIPLSLKEANEFVTKYHRHNKKCTGHKFSIGAEYKGKLVGVAIIGRPVARKLDDKFTLEINRNCVYKLIIFKYRLNFFLIIALTNFYIFDNLVIFHIFYFKIDSLSLS